MANYTTGSTTNFYETDFICEICILYPISSHYLEPREISAMSKNKNVLLFRNNSTPFWQMHSVPLTT